MRRGAIAALPVLAALGAVLGCSGAPAGAVAAGISPGTLQSALSGVSCVSSSYCVAVGSAGHSANPGPDTVPLAMIWNGTQLRETAVPLPKGWPLGQLDSVSCVSASYCVAVGGYGSGGSGGPLAETWNGRAWTATELPWPARKDYVGIAAVSCAVAGSCVVTFDGASGELLTGTKWTWREEPLPRRSAVGVLWTVSCVRAAYCVLAGEFNRNEHDSPLFELWNGRTFTAMKTGPYPDPGNPEASTAMSTVSCASASSCLATGSTTQTPGPEIAQSIAALWNGKTWSFTALAGPRGFGLLSVWCVSPSYCMGVGNTNHGTVDNALAMSYDGRSWTVTSVPALPDGDRSQFVSISCVSPAYCVAVGGGWTPPANTVTNAGLIGFWNGKSWRLVTVS